MTHPFDIATRLIPLAEGLFKGETTKAYGNMAGPYGGITAANMLQAVLQDPRHAGVPVSITVNLCGAVGDGTFDISVRPVRQGKYIQHWAVELVQNGQVLTTASVILAARGESFDHQAAMMPDAPPYDTCPVVKMAGPLPWLAAYDFRFVEGAPDFSHPPGPGPNPARSVQYIADNPPRPLDYLSLCAMIDSFVLRVFTVRPQFGPMASVSITAHFTGHADEIKAQGTVPVLGVVDAARFGGNFHDQTMQLWAQNGKLLATGSQMVWFKT